MASLDVSTLILSGSFAHRMDDVVIEMVINKTMKDKLIEIAEIIPPKANATIFEANLIDCPLEITSSASTGSSTSR